MDIELLKKIASNRAYVNFILFYYVINNNATNNTNSIAVFLNDIEKIKKNKRVYTAIKISLHAEQDKEDAYLIFIKKMKASRADNPFLRKDFMDIFEFFKDKVFNKIKNNEFNSFTLTKLKKIKNRSKIEKI